MVEALGKPSVKNPKSNDRKPHFSVIFVQHDFVLIGCYCCFVRAVIKMLEKTNDNTDKQYHLEINGTSF